MDHYIKNFSNGWEDIQSSLSRHHQITVLGWQDVATRYRRSKVGAWWLTINMLVLITTLGFVFGMLFRQPMAEYLPYLTAGFIFWGLISTVISEGCTSFIAAGETILQIRMPLFTHIARTIWRNLIISCHNMLILPLVFIVFMKPPSWTFLLIFPGLIILILNLAWVMVISAIICTRFRDATQIIQNFLQVAFYLTPVIWSPDLVPERAGTFILDMNPFYHLIQIVRAPILGDPISINTWIIAVLMAIVGWLIAIPFLGIYRKRIAYWL
ncbi:ABC transporter permease [Vibrio nigripulchritudo]|uniref:ABC transporter permease n=1 Tax=Vibrio nigripulchritudo TaxID=28173 RepID=UPI00190F6FF8|nr:ABC transporter permease [Vibrio nigripulchritudo]